jgi:polyisoprenoid-binding protein YceI
MLMPRILRLLAITASLTLAAVSFAGAEPLTLAFDRAHSEVGFNIRHFFNKTHGRFKDFSGSIVYDPGQLTTSTVEVSIVDSTIDTANERRDSDLRGPNFFDVAKYPTMTFKSTKVVPGKDANHFQVVGDFTLRGITKPVTLDAEILGMGPVTIGGRSLGTQAGFTATTTIKRQDWGITWNKTLDQGGVMLGDDVDIVLSVAAITPPPAPPAAPATPATPTAGKK